MEFAILGPLRAVGEQGPIELPAAKQRALLATLLLAHRDEAVSPERLTDVLWGEEPPATAHKALQVPRSSASLGCPRSATSATGTRAPTPSTR
jgi:DNA-binding SARP family transcriptional activator